MGWEEGEGRRHDAITRMHPVVDNKRDSVINPLSAVTRQYGGKKKHTRTISSVQNPAAATHEAAVYDAAGKNPGSISAAANADLHCFAGRYVVTYRPSLVHTEAPRLRKCHIACIFL